MDISTALRSSMPNTASSRPWSSMHHGATMVPVTNAYAVDAVAAADFYACFTTKKRPPQRLGRPLT